MAIESLEPERRTVTPDGAVCVIVRAESRIGAGAELAALLSDLAYSVREDEEGCTSYVLTRMMGSPEHFALHARFVDWRAFEEHAETPHLRRLMPRINALLAAPFTMEIFLEV
ncbi:MAG: putative quinol monooxygenase [Hyphomonadaceae bacterium]